LTSPNNPSPFLRVVYATDNAFLLSGKNKCAQNKKQTHFKTIRWKLEVPDDANDDSFRSALKCARINQA
jgi:hypothetical protein